MKELVGLKSPLKEVKRPKELKQEELKVLQANKAVRPVAHPVYPIHSIARWST